MWSVLGIFLGILALFGIGVFIALFMGAGLGSSKHSRKQNARSEAIYGVKYVPPSSALTDKGPLSALELEFKSEIDKMIERCRRQEEVDRANSMRYLWLRERMFVKRNGAVPDCYGLDEYLLAEGICEAEDSRYIDAAIDRAMTTPPTLS